MLDLREKSLPDYIEVDGSKYRIKTDFRHWLDFETKAKDPYDNLLNILDLLEDDVPQDKLFNVYLELVAFYANENSTPKKTGSNFEQVVDFVDDGEFIYSSFLQAYNIDLLKVDMHWWIFKALFLGLPEDTKIKQIMGFRGYKPSKKTNEAMYKELKSAWMLPPKLTKEEQEAMQEWSNQFYNT